MADAALDTVLAGGNSGQRVATAAVALQTEAFVELVSLPAILVGGLAVGLFSRIACGRSSARASAIEGFAAGGEIGGLLCGRACESPPSSWRRYQQLRLFK